MPKKTKIKSYVQWKKDANKEFEEIVKRDGLLVPLKIILPFVFSGIAAFFIYLLGPDIYIKLTELLGVYMFAPIGSGIGVPFGHGIGLDPVLALMFMLTVDALTSMFIIWNFDYIKIIPLARRFVKAAEDKSGKLREKYMWIKDLEFIGIAIFVFLPLYGTGVIIGAIIGRLLKMNYWRIWLAVMLGAAIRLGILTAVMSGFLAAL